MIIEDGYIKGVYHFKDNEIIVEVLEYMEGVYCKMYVNGEEISDEYLGSNHVMKARAYLEETMYDPNDLIRSQFNAIHEIVENIVNTSPILHKNKTDYVHKTLCTHLLGLYLK